MKAKSAVYAHEKLSHIEKDAAELIEMPLEPFGIYRLEFEAKCPTPAYWFADFYNSAGEHNYADNYSCVYPSDGFTQQSALFMARAEASRGKVGFRVMKAPLHVRNVRVAAIDKAQALAWMDTLYSTLPQIHPNFDKDRGGVLPRTGAALKSGKTLRVVALGDSISNDMMNGLGHLLVERQHKGVTIQAIHANGPEKSCDNYQRDDVLQRLVIRHRPDLFTVGGVSHGNAESIRTVIRKVRAACDNVETVYFDVRVDGDPDSERRMSLQSELRRMASEDGFALCDLTTPFEEAVRRSPHPRDWFIRDSSHVNDRGKQLLGRLYASYFDIPDLPARR